MEEEDYQWGLQLVDMILDSAEADHLGESVTQTERLKIGIF